MDSLKFPEIDLPGSFGLYSPVLTDTIKQMSYPLKEYIKKAKSVLDGNWNGSYTVPARGLYPHQWNWDSGFIALGYSHYDPGKAMTELSSLFNAQWKNGMVPQIVFNRNKLGNYFPEPDFWLTDGLPIANEDHLTSGITMPPIHAHVVLKIYENAGDKSEVIPFLKWIYPKLLHFHRYLYEERDPDGTGLVYIRHPWESGMDNSPTWDRVFEHIDMGGVKVPDYTRKDLSHGVAASMRPKDIEYDRFVYLVDIFRRHRYEEKSIRDECPFMVCDPLFNSILCASDEALITIGDIVGEPNNEADRWFEMTRKAISERLFHEEHGLFDSFDMKQGKLLSVDTCAGFLPLFCGAATTDQAGRLYHYLDSKSFCALHQGNCFTVPNYDTQKEGFSRVNYWRGPVWINMNWLLMNGLRQYGYHQKADALAKDILQLPIRFGFFEYFDSFDGRGYGSADFSWTASLFLDTAVSLYEMTGERPLKIRLKNRLREDRILNGGKRDGKGSLEGLSQTMMSTISDIKKKYYSPEGMVDYRAIAKSPEYGEYKKMAAGLNDYDLGDLKNEEERLAFWINLYNTIVVDGIIALGIQQSVREVMGFFSKVRYRIGGFTFSPDDIEHGILRGNSRHPFTFCRQFRFFDPRQGFVLRMNNPRIHFALVCGSRSCAPIKAYTPEHIHEELDTASLNFVNSSEVVAMPEEGRIIMSLIFKWYKQDFGGRDGVLDFIERYHVDSAVKEFIRNERERLKIGYLFYDWNLNKR